MLYNEMRLRDPDDNHLVVPIIMDSQSAQAMGHSFRDTKHTRHVARRYHYVHQGEKTGAHSLNWCNADLQLVDIGTKNLDGAQIRPRLSYLFVDVPE